MKVYVAFSGAYEQRGIVGVFATRAAAVALTMPEAIEWRREIERMYPEHAAKWKPLSEDDCDIEEHEVIP